jgi:type IV pilus biogenesis protein CpaD/CtpE
MARGAHTSRPASFLLRDMREGSGSDRRTLNRRSLAVLLALLAGGCTMTSDPTLREGTWHPTGVNAANLAAEVVNPHDLVEGEDAPGAPGPIAIGPVERLRADNVKPLPDNSIVQIGGTSTSSGGGASGGASAGGGY